MASSPAPSTGNYSILTAIVKFMREGETEYRHMGSMATIQVSTDIEKGEHFERMNGSRAKDFTWVRTKSQTITLGMEEFVPDNIAIWALGSVGSPDGIIEIMSESEVVGALRIIGTNEIGVRLQWDYPRVSFTPSGSMDLLTDDPAVMEIEGEILISGGLFGWVTPDITDEVEYAGSPG